MDLSQSEWIKIAAMFVMAANMALNVYLWMRTASAKELAGMRRAQAEGDERLSARVSAIESVSRQEIGILRSVHSDVDKRLSVLESRVEALPTHGDLRSIRDTLAEISTELAANTERSSALVESVRSLQRYLMERSK